MSIEIKELVIRATVEQPPGRTRERNNENTETEKKNCCADNLDMIIQLIKDKKER